MVNGHVVTDPHFVRATVVVTYKDGSQKMFLQDFNTGDVEAVNAFYFRNTSHQEEVAADSIHMISCNSTKCYERQAR